MDGAENGAVESFELANFFERIIEARHEQAERIEVNRNPAKDDVGGQLAFPFVKVRVQLAAVWAGVGKILDHFDFVGIAGCQWWLNPDVVFPFEQRILSLYWSSNGEKYASNGGKPKGEWFSHGVFLSPF